MPTEAAAILVTYQFWLREVGYGTSVAMEPNQLGKQLANQALRAFLKGHPSSLDLSNSSVYPLKGA